MPASIIPFNDPSRLQAVDRYEILDTPTESAFDDIAALAAEYFGVPSAFVSLVDQERVWFKANLSTLPGNEVAREHSLCSLAILQEEVTVFTDTHQIPELLQSPYVAAEGGIRFYAGAPLRTSDGHSLGTVCVVDSKPRAITDSEKHFLKRLARIAMSELELRVSARQAIRMQGELLNLAAHELKSPITNILSLAQMMPENQEQLPEIVEMITQSSQKMLQTLSNLLEAARLESEAFILRAEPTDAVELLESTVEENRPLATRKNQMLTLHTQATAALNADKVLLRNVFSNLLSNAIKFTPPGKAIRVTLEEAGDQVRCTFQDEGQGLTSRDKEKLFVKFAKLSARPTGQETSSGMGLSIVKTLVELHQGRVWAESEGKDKGSRFVVELPKRQPSA